MRYQTSNVVYDHLIEFGFDPTYNNWVWHGEMSNSSIHHEDVEMPDMYRMYRDAYFQDDGVVEPTHEREQIDRKYPSFASDPRNLRLALSTDGFNPFGDLSSRYSCWPVMLVTNYNLPPSLCMMKDNMIFSLLISGPKQPGNDIDVYLEPLIDDLKELWNNGVEVYDSFSKSMFNLKAILMWTISDYPAYGNLSGHPTKGRVACPICGVNTCSLWLDSSHKFAFMGHRRFLVHNHPFRTTEEWYDGKEEHGVKPRMLNGL